MRAEMGQASLLEPGEIPFGIRGCSYAFSTKSVCIEVLTRQPTMWCAKTSTTHATYKHPATARIQPTGYSAALGTAGKRSIAAPAALHDCGYPLRPYFRRHPASPWLSPGSDGQLSRSRPGAAPLLPGVLVFAGFLRQARG